MYKVLESAIYDEWAEIKAEWAKSGEWCTWSEADIQYELDVAGEMYEIRRNHYPRYISQ